MAVSGNACPESALHRHRRGEPRPTSRRHIAVVCAHLHDLARSLPSTRPLRLRHSRIRFVENGEEFRIRSPCPMRAIASAETATAGHDSSPSRGCRGNLPRRTCASTAARCTSSSTEDRERASARVASVRHWWCQPEPNIRGRQHLHQPRRATVRCPEPPVALGQPRILLIAKCDVRLQNDVIPLELRWEGHGLVRACLTTLSNCPDDCVNSFNRAGVALVAHRERKPRGRAVLQQFTRNRLVFALR